MTIDKLDDVRRLEAAGVEPRLAEAMPHAIDGTRPLDKIKAAPF